LVSGVPIRRFLALPLIIGVFLVGCYTYEPARTTPQPGAELAWQLNDAGRAAMGGQLGPEISQVEGRLVQTNSTNFVVAVTSVQLLRGGEQVWRGEQVTLKPEYVSATLEKKLSKSRSIAAAAVTAGVVALVITKTSLLGLGSPDPDKPSSTDSSQTVRRPRR
jgi:hypothetical protein